MHCERCHELIKLGEPIVLVDERPMPLPTLVAAKFEHVHCPAGPAAPNVSGLFDGQIVRMMDDGSRWVWRHKTWTQVLVVDDNTSDRPC